MRKIRVLVVDDHTLVRDGIRALLALSSDIEVVGESSNGKDALRQVKRLAPDVVLMDIAMPVMTGLEATRREFPGTRVLALTQYDDSEYVVPVVEAGARGFISKMAASSELASAIQAVFHGESFLSPSAAAALVEECQQKNPGDGERDAYQQLTDREREILKLVVEGHTAREIAEMLVVSPKTVEWYKSSLMNTTEPISSSSPYAKASSPSSIAIRLIQTSAWHLAHPVVPWAAARVFLGGFPYPIPLTPPGVFLLRSPTYDVAYDHSSYRHKLTSAAGEANGYDVNCHPSGIQGPSNKVRLGGSQPCAAVPGCVSPAHRHQGVCGPGGAGEDHGGIAGDKGDQPLSLYLRLRMHASM